MLIAITGRARSGKDTTADLILKHRPRAQRIAFADPLKAFVREVFDFSDEQMHGALKETQDPRYLREEKWAKCVSCDGRGWHNGLADDGRTDCGTCKGSGRGPLLERVYLTPRHAMQTLGTEWGRSCFKDVWVHYALRRAERALQTTRVVNKPFDAGTGTSGKGSSIVQTCDTVVITDLRFLNEARAIRAAGGVIWRVNRAGSGLKGDGWNHPSEVDMHTDQMSELVNVDLDNNGTLAALEAKVVKCLSS